PGTHDTVDLDSYLYTSVHLSASHHLFIFNATATPDIYTLSLHDALPISIVKGEVEILLGPAEIVLSIDEEIVHHLAEAGADLALDRKSTRLNSSHQIISYAVFCLKKKNKLTTHNSDMNA